jgi:hypothetical protein
MMHKHQHNMLGKSDSSSSSSSSSMHGDYMKIPENDVDARVTMNIPGNDL